MDPARIDVHPRGSGDEEPATLKFPIGVDTDALAPKAHLDRVVEEVDRA